MMKKEISTFIESTNEELKQTNKKEKNKSNIPFFLFIIICLAICSFFGYKAYHDPIAIAQEKYSTAKEEAYNDIYEKSYTAAEKKWHVSNDVIIEVEGIRETAVLQVLEVHDIEYIMNQKENEGVLSCLEVTGSGDFTVDLKASEFVVDDERQYVLVRIPIPSLNNCKITNREVLAFKDGVFDKSVKQGVELAEEDLKEAKLKIETELGSNVEYFEKAKDAAVIELENLVRQFNPDAKNLTVEVEFFE